MRKSYTAVFLWVCGTLALAGCTSGGEAAPDPDGLDPPEAQAALRSDGPPAGLNGLTPACFWAPGSQAALRSLGGAALDQGNGAFPQVPLSQIPASCRTVLTKTVACALPQGQTLTDPVTGDTYGGWWGLAPSWQNGALDAAGRRYVTACLAQTLNAYGVSVPIVLEGPAPAIQQDPALDVDYSIEESTAFGDLFSSSTPLLGLLPAFNLYVCWEDLLPQSCSLPLLGQRICDGAPLCGLVNLGPCSLSCVPNGPYNQCQPGVLGLLAPYVTETVRARLDPTTCH